MLIIDINNLSVDYGSNTVIDTFSLKLEQPKLIAVIGLNGSGKSTLLKAITKKVDYTGEINLNSQVAYLGQKNNVGFPISVEELLLMGRFRELHFSQPYSEEDKSKAQDLMSRLGGGHLYEKQFNELSGGEQQLVWIAQTLLQDLPVIILDEPTQQLDLRNKRRVFDLLNQQVVEKNKTVLCVTHDLYLLDKYEGDLLNFSKENPELEKITPLSLQQNIEYLEVIA